MISKLKSKFYLLVFLPVLILFTSCEGMKFADGGVYELSTIKPIDSVLCKVVETGTQLFTDSTGKYSLDGPFGSCMKECPDMTVEYSKFGFKTIKIKNPGKENVFLEKL